ncbi:hypothetical protein DWB77_03556 [Streptomyces hundungensis]|uniref:Uncharacterized protein n=1 Tax=Streptomyces hundungensis TaxID=1077946 RepID=A0A387HKR3_9ACTN|nr:hypothetical protein [Streptomyces hundungensis]AYG81410.1 hypothetical protein DWB77_03556 [Streptomyces hundungensis]
MSTAAYPESWQRLLDQAGPPPAPSLHLASAAPGGGDLHHTPKPWNDAAGAAHSLRTDTDTARSGLITAHAGLDTSGAGLLSVTALKTVLTSWEQRLGAVRDECADLEPKLREVARTMGGTDHAVRSSIAGYADPVPADEKGR